jgi:hypothetical protein
MMISKRRTADKTTENHAVGLRIPVNVARASSIAVKAKNRDRPTTRALRALDWPESLDSHVIIAMASTAPPSARVRCMDTESASTPKLPSIMAGARVVPRPIMNVTMAAIVKTVLSVMTISYRNYL